MGGRTGGLEAPSLVDGDVHQHRTLAHGGHQVVGDQFGSLGPHDQDGADHDVGVDAGLLDGVGARGHRLQCAPKMVVDPAEALEVAIEDEDLRVHAHGEGGRGHAGDAGPQDHDFGAANTGHPAHQDTPSAPGLIRWWAPTSGAIRPATSLIGVSSGSELSARRTVS